MKVLLLIPAMCLFCFGCSHDDNGDTTTMSQSQESSADWEITTKVKAEILANTSISAFARFISVSTMDGVVTLTGTVPTKQDRERIGRIARNVRGVVSVDNQITISNN